MQLGSDRRRTPRVRCEIPVEYTPCGLLWRRLEGVSLRGTVVDASVDERGLSFVTSHSLFTGRKLRVVTGGVARSAEVRWVGAVPEGYRVGVAIHEEPLTTQRC